MVRLSWFGLYRVQHSVIGEAISGKIFGYSVPHSVIGRAVTGEMFWYCNTIISNESVIANVVKLCRFRGRFRMKMVMVVVLLPLAGGMSEYFSVNLFLFNLLEIH